MEKRNRSSDVEGRKVQKERQDREIKEKLYHIKNKILVMSGKGGVGKSRVDRS
jgi:Mrp family chromosome partitioning ATPase